MLCFRSVAGLSATNKNARSGSGFGLRVWVPRVTVGIPICACPLEINYRQRGKALFLFWPLEVEVVQRLWHMSLPSLSSPIRDKTSSLMMKVPSLLGGFLLPGTNKTGALTDLEA